MATFFLTERGGNGRTWQVTADVVVPALPTRPSIDVASYTTRIFMGTPPDGSASRTKAVTVGALIRGCTPRARLTISGNLIRGQTELTALSRDPEYSPIVVTCNRFGVTWVHRTFYGDSLTPGAAKVLFFITREGAEYYPQTAILAQDNEQVTVPR